MACREFRMMLVSHSTSDLAAEVKSKSQASSRRVSRSSMERDGLQSYRRTGCACTQVSVRACGPTTSPLVHFQAYRENPATVQSQASRPCHWSWAATLGTLGGTMQPRRPNSSAKHSASVVAGVSHRRYQYSPISLTSNSMHDPELGTYGSTHPIPGRTIFSKQYGVGTVASLYPAVKQAPYSTCTGLLLTCRRAHLRSLHSPDPSHSAREHSS
mmetsp:Transcript_8819/g.24786  ORF Transcript_8819/g.24786 Transcript_8819/m.24786 type:complete len:214 (+) Transcript_8819:840-1481(+)